MSNTSNTTSYTINCTGMSGADGGVLNFSSQDGYSDAFVIALAQAMKGVNGWQNTNPVSATKTVTDATSYSADLTTGTFV